VRPSTVEKTTVVGPEVEDREVDKETEVEKRNEGGDAHSVVGALSGLQVVMMCAGSWSESVVRETV
jgi:hypothetical protein